MRDKFTFCDVLVLGDDEYGNVIFYVLAPREVGGDTFIWWMVRILSNHWQDWEPLDYLEVHDFTDEVYRRCPSGCGAYVCLGRDSDFADGNIMVIPNSPIHFVGFLDPKFEERAVCLAVTLRFAVFGYHCGEPINVSLEPYDDELDFFEYHRAQAMERKRVRSLDEGSEHSHACSCCNTPRSENVAGPYDWGDDAITEDHRWNSERVVPNGSDVAGEPPEDRIPHLEMMGPNWGIMMVPATHFTPGVAPEPLPFFNHQASSFAPFQGRGFKLLGD